MDAAREYWRDWVGYWGYVNQQAMDRWFNSAQKLRDEKYGVSNLMSDVVGFWTNTAMASLYMWRGRSRTPEPVTFRLDPHDQQAGPKFVPIFAPSLPSKPPTFAWLKCLDDPPPPKKHQVDWEHLKVRFSDDRTELEIRLLGLGERTPLAPATYRAIVLLDETPVAEVIIVVRDTTDFGEAATEAAKKKAAAKRRAIATKRQRKTK